MQTIKLKWDPKVMARTLVTIVTPVFNQGDFVSRTIQSVLDQSYDNIEYIIVDDGSTDDTASILERYRSKAIIIRQENCGQSAALNLGWSMAQGHVLAYLSADDIMYTDCVANIVNAFEDDVSVVYPDYDLIDAHGDIIRGNECEEFSRERLFCGLVCMPGAGAFFTKDAYLAVGGWHASLQHVPDFEFWLRMVSQGRFKRLPEPLAGFRVHSGSGSVKPISAQRSDEIIHIVEKYKKIIEEVGPLKKPEAAARLMAARSHLQSGRYITGFKRYSCAISIVGLTALGLDNLRFVFSGAIRRQLYRLKLVFKC